MAMNQRVMNMAFALVWLFALSASIGVFRADIRRGAPSRRFLETYTMNLRRPELVKTVSLADDAAEAADLVADSALRDALAPASLASLTPRVRMAWLDMPSHLDDELRQASELMLDSLSDDPGWPYHAALLGKSEYTRMSRVLSPSVVTQYQRWRTPLLAGTTAATVDQSLWQALAFAYLQTWPDLGRVYAAESPVIFRHAFEDADFVNSAFPLAIQTLGKAAAVRAVPSVPAPLWSVFQQFGRSGDIASAWPVYQRWSEAEWRSRNEDIAAIETQVARRNSDDARALCYGWTSTHHVWDFDSGEAWAQAAHLLDLWPAVGGGAWDSDPRADIVRYLLRDSRASTVGTILSTTLDALSGVPEPVQAEVKVLANDVPGAEAMARASDTAGGFDWTPFYVKLAYKYLDSGKKDDAAAALKLAPEAAQNECDIALARIAVDRANGSTVSDDLLLFPHDYPADYWSGGRLPVCVNSFRNDRSLLVEASAVSPSIVSYGFDGARLGAALLPAGHSLIQLPVAGRGGRHIVSVLSIAGGDTTPLAARLR